MVGHADDAGSYNLSSCKNAVVEAAYLSRVEDMRKWGEKHAEKTIREAMHV